MCTLLESYHHPLQGNGVKLEAGILSTLLSFLWDDERCTGKRPFPSCSFVVTFHTAPSLYQGMSLPKAGISQFERIHLHAVFQPLTLFFSYNHNVEGKMAGITVNWIQSKYKCRCEINQQLCGVTSASNDVYLQMSPRFSKDFVSSALIYWICMSCQNAMFIFIFSI
jgi:hypothetical protein